MGIFSSSVLQPDPQKPPLSSARLIASARISPNFGATQSATPSHPVASRDEQQKAWSFYDSVGEFHYANGFLGSCLSRCLLTVGVPDGDGSVGPPVDDQGNELLGADIARSYVRSLRSEIGGQPQMLRAMGINLGVAAEFHLVGRKRSSSEDLGDLANIDDWEVLSSDEFRLVGTDFSSATHYERIRYPGAIPENIPINSVHVIRVWRSHPRFSDLPDLSATAVQDVLEELLLLTREVRGDVLSRLANAGLLLIPDEIQSASDPTDDQDSDTDAFTDELLETMSTAIRVKESAAGVVPIVIRAPAELLSSIRFLELAPSRTSNSVEKRREAVQRLAQGLDLPVEIVTGHAETTFSNAVSIDDSLFKSHIEPMLEIICDALTVAFLRPLMGDDSPFVVTYDASKLVTRPNRAQDAKDAYDRFELSGNSLRDSLGFSDKDAPSEQEVAVRLKQSQPAASSEVVDDSLDQGGQEDGNNTDGLLQASLLAAAEVSVERAVRRAGARLRSKAAKIPERSLLDRVPDAEVAQTLGPAVVAKIRGTDQLLDGEFDTLRDWVLGRTGDRHYAEALASYCTSLATERLYDPQRPFELTAAVLSASIRA